MNQYTQGRPQSQVRRIAQCRQQMMKDQDLCFRRLLPQEQVEAALERHHVCYRKCLYTPLLTIWTFLYQVLARTNPAGRPWHACWPSCAWGETTRPAPKPIPTARLVSVCRRSSWPIWPAAVALELQQQVASAELLGGRPIKIADGTTISMPDTPANQKAYPQQAAQKKGLGFPILRLVGLIGLSCGAVLDVAMAPYHGKQTGETALLRQMLDSWDRGCPAGRCHFLQLLDDRPVATARGGSAGPSRRHASDRFPSGPAAGPLRSYRVLAQTAAAVVDEPQALRPSAGYVAHSRNQGGDLAEGLSCHHLLLVTTLLDAEAFDGRNWRRRFVAAGMRNWTCVRSSR